MSDKIAKPLLFSAPMVRALLDGSKTQTRRIFKGYTPPDCPGVHTCIVEDGWAKFHLNGRIAMHGGEWTKCPHPVGSFIWVKETFQRVHPGMLRLFDPDPESPQWETVYLADGDPAYWPEYGLKWKPSIFMPKWASRITLEVLSVRVERLDDISQEDAKAEGVDPKSNSGNSAYTAYAALWESINGQDSWALNPWVWVYEFRRVKP